MARTGWINSFFVLSFTSKVCQKLEWKESKNFGKCREARNRLDTTVSKKRDNDGIRSQMGGGGYECFFSLFNRRFPFVRRREESRRIRRIKRDLNFEEERKGKGKKTCEKKKVGMVELQSDINNNKVLMAGRRLK